MKDLARRVNFFSSTFLALLGFSLASEIFLEDDMPDKLDDIMMVVLSFVAIYWYKKMGFKANNSVGAVILVAVGLVTKIGAIMIEHADKEAVGDDIGIAIALGLALIFVLWQTYFVKAEK